MHVFLTHCGINWASWVQRPATVICRYWELMDELRRRVFVTAARSALVCPVLRTVYQRATWHLCWACHCWPVCRTSRHCRKQTNVDDLNPFMHNFFSETNFSLLCWLQPRVNRKNKEKILEHPISVCLLIVLVPLLGRYAQQSTGTVCKYLFNKCKLFRHKMTLLTML